MGYRAPFPVALQQVEYTRLYFYLEFDSCFDLPRFGLLQLRRELMQTMKSLSDEADVTRLKQLFQPEIATDPVVRRQVQKPAPAVVISPDSSQCGLIEPKQQLVLPVLFLGNGIGCVAPFIALMRRMEGRGIYHGTGTFKLVAVDAEDGSGVKARFWSTDAPSSELTPPVNNLAWWLERQGALSDHANFEVLSPIRALHKGKPQFKAHFSAVFPLVLRRVSALVTAHAGVELIDDPGLYFELAGQVESVDKPLSWNDWRTLKPHQGGQQLGGLTGVLTLKGAALEELWWLLCLGSLFNIGKGAAYGAGQYRINWC